MTQRSEVRSWRVFWATCTPCSVGTSIILLRGVLQFNCHMHRSAYQHVLSTILARKPSPVQHRWAWRQTLSSTDVASLLKSLGAKKDVQISLCIGTLHDISPEAELCLTQTVAGGRVLSITTLSIIVEVSGFRETWRIYVCMSTLHNISSEAEQCPTQTEQSKKDVHVQSFAHQLVLLLDVRPCAFFFVMGPWVLIPGCLFSSWVLGSQSLAVFLHFLL